MVFVASLLQTSVYECPEPTSAEEGEGAPQCDPASPTGQNIFFNVDSMEPLILNPAFREAVDIFNRIAKSSNCQEQLNAGKESWAFKCNRQAAFREGRCAGVLSMPGTMTRMLLPYQYGQ